jgi:oligopeptide/dipeptide ABC transporter ATP-binding protein
MTSPLLEIEGFSLGFNTEAGLVSVVDDISLNVMQGETLGLVGESGCGKSVTAMSIMRLLPAPPAKVLGGHIRFDKRDLIGLDERSMRDLRGNQIGMIFQEPMTSLNPTYTIGFQLREALQLHLPLSRAQADERAAALLDMVGIGAAARRLRQYPHELSGGLRQRVMIAMAIACEPKLIIADEPTTALDVTIQAQILDLLRDLRSRLNTAILMITHDLGVVAEFCERVLVMYAGRIVEQANVVDLFHAPRHPYTQGLLRSMPATAKRGARLPMIKGAVPAPGQRGAGCPFADRCDRVQDRCHAETPPLEYTRSANRSVACWNPVE